MLIICYPDKHPPDRPRVGTECALRSNNNKHSGGLPHSEIHGSKRILSSPWLIAEYHVFHRLLLPRHPPNALFALDLIQKKSDFFSPTPFCIVIKGELVTSLRMHVDQNAYIAVLAAGSQRTLFEQSYLCSG